LDGDTVRGNIAAGYEEVGAVFRGFFERNWDTGSAASVYVGGTPVVRLTGGSRIVPGDDAAPYDDHTIQLVASTTKFVESLCVMLLVDRGLLRSIPGAAGAGAGTVPVRAREWRLEDAAPRSATGISCVRHEHAGLAEGDERSAGLSLLDAAVRCARA
jgi:hypothetical protein